MYVREIDGKETTFGTSGALWRDALVLYDRDTGSYWSQINATSILGEHEGKTLEEIPSVVTTWKEWRELHADTLVLEKPPLTGSPYARYNENPEAMGRGRASADDRLPGKDLVVGVRSGDAAAAVPLLRLQESGVVNGTVGGTPVAWVALPGGAAAAFARRSGGTTVELRPGDDGKLVDAATGSVFDAESGRGIEGKLAGVQLERLPALRVFWYSWTSFHPDTALVD